eukprot:CAMPEP_0177504906 /NCGR_PEP_ID=MMETSP0369-20130122/39115_1 /TAXON_ID=447022 ORGANISM="Scrippsiella hangoei-like, Strain SHHI-4" /NCGR_SAMPLE_ID=MMETSP0369 /ASSEMBLY_ACC=CAM_ASM_000364 /LENGTH=110 /DNA_ID=CAMNT_0018982725 /DNA_START=56 /DNA_END=388 /DNA_ORIENTATION=+
MAQQMDKGAICHLSAFLYLGHDPFRAKAEQGPPAKYIRALDLRSEFLPTINNPLIMGLNASLIIGSSANVGRTRCRVKATACEPSRPLCGPQQKTSFVLSPAWTSSHIAA